jgi:hypothetical protein
VDAHQPIRCALASKASAAFDLAELALGQARMRGAAVALSPEFGVPVGSGKMGKDRDVDSVLCKCAGVLGHAELIEPRRNLLH